MRTILCILFITIFLIFSLPVMLIEFIIGKFSKHHSDMVMLGYVQFGFKVVLLLSGVKLIVEGEDNVPRDQAVLYIGNHRGFFDIVATYSRCPNLTGYISKKSIEKVPLISFLMKRVYCLLMDRTDIRQSMGVILKAIEYVKSGISICIFPEGTRIKTSSRTQTLPFKEGSFKIAQKSKCPIVPMAITGTEDVLENHFPWIKRAKVVVRYGKPFYISDLEKEQQKKVGVYTRAIIEDMLIDIEKKHY